MFYNGGMKKKLIFLFLMVPLWSFGKEFRYQFEEGAQYKARSIVREQVYLNNKYISHSEILNRFSVKTVGVRPDGRGELEAFYDVAETVVRPHSSLNLYRDSTTTSGKSYYSRFCQDAFGRFSEDEDDFMPVVRNVPLFPEKDLQPGDQWSAPGYEVHDFREAFGMSKGFRYDTQVSYRYIGETNRNGHLLDEIEATSFASVAPTAHLSTVPTRVVSQVQQKLWWDNEAGRLVACQETFDILFLFRDGTVWNFKGESEAEIVEVLKMDRKVLVDDLKRQLDNEEIAVEEQQEGIRLTFKNLQFYPDEDRLLPGEELKLEEMARVLKQIPGYDIRVIGHTAEAGTPEKRLQLSLERAGRVAEELIHRGARDAKEVLIDGKGSTEPIASNETESGRALNRRVEILIVDEYN